MTKKVDLPLNDRINIQTGDKIGFTEFNQDSVIQYSLAPRSLNMITYENYSTPEVGRSYKFDSVRYGRIYQVSIDIGKCHWC